MELKSTNCPNCGNPIKVDMTKKNYFCQYCGSQLLFDDGVQKVQHEVTGGVEFGYQEELGRQKALEELQKKKELEFQQQDEENRRRRQEYFQRQQEELQRYEQERIKREKKMGYNPKGDSKKYSNMASFSALFYIIGTIIIVTKKSVIGFVLYAVGIVIYFAAQRFRPKKKTSIISILFLLIMIIPAVFFLFVVGAMLFVN